ncbi:MAG: class I tRNA ligase family protein [Candidatus Uhrbacteria bacterium]
MPYDHQAIEKKWQKKWADSGVFQTQESPEKKKFYALDMFPYPSGAGLHVGHPKGYIATDVVARSKMMQGYNVLHPMGWDAFGLPAENYAIKNKVHPAVATEQNIETFKKQLSVLGFTYDWEREVNTTDPKYYKWTQWAFLQMFKKGLAYESFEPINWCPSCQTGLANEDLDGDKCERCGSLVEQKPMRQWVLKITNYADRLLGDLSLLSEWPESIKQMQREWIGRSEGAEVSFHLTLSHLSPGPSPEGRGDTLGRVTTDSATWNLLRDKSLEMKKNPTKAEAAMWEIVRRDAVGSHFRRQQIIGNFIVDFVCLKKRLVIEVDGDVHDNQKDEDEKRTKFLNEKGFEVIRFRNEEVLLDAGRVASEIAKKIKETPDIKTLPSGEGLGEVIKVFTTRPDTLFGATYLVLAPEHPLVSQIATEEQRAEVETYVTAAKDKTDIERGDDTKEKTGVFTGAYAINPVNSEEIPIWVADYVLSGYGTGAIMAVPAHDERDFAFAKKFNLPIRQVVEPKFINTNSGSDNAIKPDLSFVDRGAVVAVVRNPKDDTYLCISWKNFLMHGLVTGGIEDGEDPVKTAQRELVEETGYKNFRYLRTSPIAINTYFYHRVKQQNRHAHFQFVFFELENEERVPMEKADEAQHEVVWKKKSELKDFFTVYEGEFILNILENDDYCFADEGLVVNSDFLDGLPTWKAKDDIISWLAEKGLGQKKIQYKLRDWVFSRQRYWGEPIPLVHCESCKNKIEKETIKLSFYDQNTWTKLISGHKTIETRALNPEEPERYFGNIGVNKYLCAVNKVTGEEKHFRVTNVWQFKTLEELLEMQEILPKIWPGCSDFSLENRRQAFAQHTPGYLERIEKNGLIAWQVEMVTPGIVPLPEAELPLELPQVEHYEPSGTGESPLATIADWVNTKCPVCCGSAKRETNTMPQWAGSCWYYLRYCDPKNNVDFFKNDGFKFRPAIEATEMDKKYFDEFKKIYSEFKNQKISVWAANRFLLNGLNGNLWLPFRTICLMTWENDRAKVENYLVELGYKLIETHSTNYLFEKDGLRVEIVAMFNQDGRIFSQSYQNGRQEMSASDLPENELGHLWNFSYRIVSPEYNLRHYKYINEHERIDRGGLGDEDKIAFLQSWVDGVNEKIRFWQPVDLYVGGAEHATRHLIYARFWHKFLYGLGVVSGEEPFMRLQNVGLILAEDGRKMSKRWGNVINPDDVVREYGADALRVYEMFMGPFNQPAAWSTNGLVGARRFLEKVNGLVSLITEKESEKVTRALHQTIKKVSDDIDGFRFNTAVAQMMTFVNVISEEKTITRESLLKFLSVLCPFAPHLTNEIAADLGGVEILESDSWPTYDPEMLKVDEITMAVQVNGKLRGTVVVPTEATEEEIKNLANNEENVKKHLAGKEIVKVIFVKGKLVNIVIK